MTDLETLKLIIKDKNLSQKDLASYLDVSKQFISALLKPKSTKKISKKLLSKIKSKFPNYFNPIEKLELPKQIDKKYLEIFRKHYNYTKIEIAKYLGISQPYYILLTTGDRNITDNIVKRLELLNENPNQKIDITLVEKNQPIEIDYYGSLEDINSKHARKLYIDKLFLSNRDLGESNIICLKFNSSHESFNILIDTSQPLENNKRFLIKNNNKFYLCSVSFNKDKIKCTSIFSNKDTFYFDSNTDSMGELIGLFKV